MFGKNRPLSELGSLLRQANTARDGKDFAPLTGMILNRKTFGRCSVKVCRS